MSNDLDNTDIQLLETASEEPAHLWVNVFSEQEPRVRSLVSKGLLECIGSLIDDIDGPSVCFSLTAQGASTLSGIK